MLQSSLANDDWWRTFWLVCLTNEIRSDALFPVSALRDIHRPSLCKNEVPFPPDCQQSNRTEKCIWNRKCLTIRKSETCISNWRVSMDITVKIVIRILLFLSHLSRSKAFHVNSCVHQCVRNPNFESFPVEMVKSACFFLWHNNRISQNRISVQTQDAQPTF